VIYKLGYRSGSEGGREMAKRHYTPEQIVGKLSDELLTGEIVSTLKEAQILIGRWHREYNTVRPLALDYRPPTSEAIQVTPRNPGYTLLRSNR
jgi:putative transposase